jgi:hypothetical protein
VGKARVGWGRCLEERALTCPCSAADWGAGRKEGAGAPDTCWGCEMQRLPDAGSRFWRWERLAGLQPSAL